MLLDVRNCQEITENVTYALQYEYFNLTKYLKLNPITQKRPFLPNLNTLSTVNCRAYIFLMLLTKRPIITSSAAKVSVST